MIVSVGLLVVGSMDLKLAFGGLAVREKHLDYEFSLGVTILAEHHSVEASVSVLALGIDICSNLYQLLDALDILVDYRDV